MVQTFFMGEICELFSKMLPSRLTCNSSEGKVIKNEKIILGPNLKVKMRMGHAL